MSTEKPQYLPGTFSLPMGLDVKIELIPMPKKRGSGRYEPAPDTDIQVSLFRGEELVERRRWDSLINGQRQVALVDGTVLGPDDIEQLDIQGWDRMLDYGIVPTAMV